MRRFLFLAGAVVLLLMLPRTIQRALTVSHPHSELIAKRIFAYRDWQSTGVRIDQGDLVEIEAQGNGFTRPMSITGRKGTLSFPRPASTPFRADPAAPSSGESAKTGSASSSARV